MGRISVTGFVGFGVFVVVCLWGGVTEKKFPPLVYLAKSDGRHRKHLCNDNLYFLFFFIFHQGREQSWQEQDFLPQEAEIYTL